MKFEGFPAVFACYEEIGGVEFREGGDFAAGHMAEGVQVDVVNKYENMDAHPLKLTSETICLLRLECELLLTVPRMAPTHKKGPMVSTNTS